MTLAAGSYAAIIYCVNSNTYAYRKIIFSAQPGQSYTSFCKAILGERNMIGLRKLDAIEAYIVNSKDFSVEMTKDMINEVPQKAD